MNPSAVEICNTIDDDCDSLVDDDDGSLDRTTGSVFYQDSDADGWNNLTEYNNRTHPNVADTDGDGVNDPADAFPLDPSQSSSI